MAYTPEAPPTVEVEGPKVSKDLTHFHIHTLLISVNPNSSIHTSIKAQFSRGYMDGDTYVVANMESVLLDGDALLAAMQAVTTGGSLYDEVRKAVWALLLSEGHLPAGAAV